MKIAIMTSLPAEWDMNVNACHQLKSLIFFSAGKPACKMEYVCKSRPNKIFLNIL
jgi:hypothetical protein